MDIIYVAYNSEKWIGKCFKSLHYSDYDLKELNIFVVDNNSADRTPEMLEDVKVQYGGMFGEFNVLESEVNLGFGQANNLAFSKGESDIVLFLNIDTEVMPDMISNVEKEIINSPDDVAMWEIRQFPYEHPKVYNPINMETSWCSGAAFAVRRKVFAEVGGFEKKIFLYNEDVDLSWRIRCNNYKIHYCPRAVINHYSYQEPEEIKPNQYVYTTINNLLLRYRFGGMKDVLRWYRFFCYILRSPSQFKGAKRQLVRKWLNLTKDRAYFKESKNINETFMPQFIGMEFEQTRCGAFYVNKRPLDNPLVSVIIRTCGRPQVLRETLLSVKNQTYANLEVVIVEDGLPESREMIEQDFADLNINYFATEQKVGRSRAGNMALSKSKGKYVNFLDDDDLFYAEHVEVLVYNLEHTCCKAAYAVGCETQIEVKSYAPYEYKVYACTEVHKQKFDKIVLCHHNYIPIQCIMFERALYEKYGGFDETLDALEDWDLWVRYSLHTDFMYVEKTTSIYRVPYNEAQSAERQKKLDQALEVVREKHKNYMQGVSVYALAKLYEDHFAG